MSTASLSRPGVAAVKWSVLATGARMVLQLGAQVLLARTLGPEVFGVFAIGLVVLTFASFVGGFGFSWSLMQRQSLCDEDIRFAWTWQLLTGLMTMLAVFALAPPMAQYFREPRAEWVIQCLSVACLLQCAAAPATYLLQRDLNFRAVGLVQVGSYALGYVAVGLPLALNGAGVAALVAAWLVQAGATLVASYALKPHPVRLLFWYPDARAAMGMGQAVFWTNLVNWSLNNLDRVLIGRLLNAQALGLYNVAYNLATLPNSLLLGALQPAFMAAGARLQSDRQRLARVYLQMVGTLLVLGLPTFTALALLAPTLVQCLYGPAWQAAGPVLAILFWCLPAYVMWGISTPVLWNSGRPHLEYALQLPVLLVGAAAFYALGGQGLAVAAGVAGGLLVLRAVVIVSAAFWALRLRWNAFLPDATRGVCLAALAAGGVWLGLELSTALAQKVHAQAWLALLCGSLLALLAAGLPVLLWPGLLGEATITMLLRFAPQLAPLLHQRPAARELSEPLAQPAKQSQA